MTFLFSIPIWRVVKPQILGKKLKTIEDSLHQREKVVNRVGNRCGRVLCRELCQDVSHVLRRPSSLLEAEKGTKSRSISHVYEPDLPHDGEEPKRPRLLGSLTFGVQIAQVASWPLDRRVNWQSRGQRPH